MSEWSRLTLPPEVVTGEAVALELRPASFATRALALALDLGIMAAVGLGLGWLLSLLPVTDEAVSAAIALVAVVAVIVGLPVTVETLTRGRSVGKIAAGLRVVRDDGGPVRFRHALVRGLLGVVEIFATLGSVALITSLLNPRGKRLGDLLAGTFVLRERGGGAVVPLPPMPPELAGWAMNADIAVPDPLAVRARRFLAGAGAMHAGSRHQLGGDLASELIRHVAPPPPPGTPPERVVAAVLVERSRRDAARLRLAEEQRAAREARRAAGSVLLPGSSRLLGDDRG